MILTAKEITELPFACALFDQDNSLVACTKEWVGNTPGCVSYPIRTSRLVIAPKDADPSCSLIIARLLKALDDGSMNAAGETALRIKMLTASLRLLVGESPEPPGTTANLLEAAKAGIEARSTIELTIISDQELPVSAPLVGALVLVQLAVNAEVHEGAKKITIQQQGYRFHLLWRTPPKERSMEAHRLPSERERWGIGFTRIAADSLGGTVYAPVDQEDGFAKATLELGLSRLSLPLACIQYGEVKKGTPTWDEETGLTVGKGAQSNSTITSLTIKAGEKAGEIVHEGGWAGRLSDPQLWVAIPPLKTTDRARDVVHGITHESALWENTKEPARSKIFAYASLLGVQLDTPFPRVPAKTWKGMMQELEKHFEIPLIPNFSGKAVIDPRIVAIFAEEYGDKFVATDQGLYLRIRKDKRDDPFIRLFLNEGDSELKLA